jgi:hypothetical protein
MLIFINWDPKCLNKQHIRFALDIDHEKTYLFGNEPFQIKENTIVEVHDLYHLFLR